MTFNPELIKKYKKEFDFMINGGNLWIGRSHPVNGWHWSKHTANHPGDEIDWNAIDYEAIVIDDEYAEFRKAIYEGKLVQFSRGKLSGWKTLGENPKFERKPEDYRIIEKEERIVKPGEWVILKNLNKVKVKSVKGDTVDLRMGKNTTFTTSIGEIEKWEPIYGELVWAIIENANPILARFIGVCEDTGKIRCRTNSDRKIDIIEPYSSMPPAEMELFL